MTDLDVTDLGGTGRSTMSRRAGRRGPARLLLLGAALVAFATVLAAGAAPASAHAVLVSSDPGEGERLPTSPSQVSLSFSEGVDAGLGGIQVLDGSGNRVDVGQPVQPTASQLQVDVEPDLAEGTYLISYRIVSADGHPVSGAVVFAVGDEIDAASVAGVGGTDDPTTDLVDLLGRVLTYLGTLLAAGLAAFLAFVHDGGRERPRLVALARGAGAVAVLGLVPLVAAQSALSTGRGLGAVTDGEVLSAVLRTAGLGWSIAVLLAGLAMLHLAVGSANPQVRQGLTLYGGLVACGSFLLWGHSTEADPVVLAGAADLVHVTVAALWLGGLVGLALTLTWRSPGRAPHGAGASAVATAGPGTAPKTTGSDRPVGDGGSVEPGTTAVLASDDPESGTGVGIAVAPTTASDDRTVATGTVDSAGVVLRFSNVAAYSVVALWLSGVAMAWTLADLPGDLVDTTWGTWLLVKGLLVVAVLALAGWNRWRLVPSLLAAADVPDPTDDDAEGPVGAAEGSAPDGGDPDGGARDDGAPDEAAVRADAAWSLLRRSVLVEGAVLLLVVLATGALVNTPPGAGAAGGGVYQATVPVDDQLQVELLVSPAVAGRNSIHVTYADELGRPADQPEGATIRARLVEPAVGPIEIEATKAGPGHFTTTADALSVPGTWELELVTRIDEFTAERTTFQVPVDSP